MRVRYLWEASIILFLFLSGTLGNAALIMDSTESLNPVFNESDSAEAVSQELFPLTEAPQINTEPIRTEPPTLQSEQQWHDLRDKILLDFSGRISPDFHIPEKLTERTKFWFDIYSRYGQAQHVIHHALYPWIVFKVVDATETILHGKGPQWLRYDQAEKMTKFQVAQIRRTLVHMANRKDFAHLSTLERELYDKLMPLKGPRRTVFRLAAQNVRSQLGQKDFFERGLVNSSRYLPYMEAEFKRRGLPTELTRMPFVESSFNEEAFSKVGASGIWQIMPNTGKAYMIVNQTIDERNSPLKATWLAGRLLHSYNHVLNSWPLTITSYNHGIGNIQKAIREAHTKDLAEIIARYHRGDFRFASANFYTCFLAALYAEKYNELIFKEMPREPLQEQEVLKLTGRTPLHSLEKVIGLSSKDLLKYNLDLKSAFRANAALPAGFQLHLPPGYRGRLLRQIGNRDKPSEPTT